MLRSLSLAVLLLSSATAFAEPEKLTTVSTTSAGAALAVQCGSSASGHCHYMVYVSDCTEKTEDNGVEHRNCETREFVRFTLVAGQSKTVEHLPKKARYCFDFNGIASLQACTMHSIALSP